MTLYDDLGVARDASQEEIRRAYRKASKRAHPDGGGSEEKFHALTRAYGILRDQARRSRYDATGETESIGPDNATAEIMETIARHLEAVMQDHIANGGHLLTSANMVETIVRKLQETHRSLEQVIIPNRQQVSYWRRVRGRFSRKKGQSVLGSIVNARISDYERAIDEGERRKGVIAKAIDLVKDESFRIDETSVNPMMLKIDPNFQVFGMFGR